MIIKFSVTLYPLLFTLYSYSLDLFVLNPNPLTRSVYLLTLKWTYSLTFCATTYEGADRIRIQSPQAPLSDLISIGDFEF